jgi:hypothetical protein
MGRSRLLIQTAAKTDLFAGKVCDAGIGDIV